jgi:hypothetical protein
MILNLLLYGSKAAGEIADKLRIQECDYRSFRSLHVEQTVGSHFKIKHL